MWCAIFNRVCGVCAARTTMVIAHMFFIDSKTFERGRCYFEEFCLIIQELVSANIRKETEALVLDLFYQIYLECMLAFPCAVWAYKSNSILFYVIVHKDTSYSIIP